jgi:hypothetical protein
MKRRHLEKRLRDEQPAPRREFLSRMVARTQTDHRPASGRLRFRVGLAVGVATLTAIAAGSFGGLGYAAGAVSHASDSVAQTFQGLTDSSSSGASGSIAANSVSAADEQYTATGYYCFNKNKTYKLQYISSQNDFNAQSNGGFTAVAYYPTDSHGACPPA